MKHIFIAIVTILLISNQTVFAQIHDIKKKSDNNSNSSDGSLFDGEELAEEALACCVSNLVYMLVDGCLTNIISGNNKSKVQENDMPLEENEYADLQLNKRSDNDYVYNDNYNDNNDYKSDFYTDVNALLDISGHKGLDKNYLHINYLPGLRVSWLYLMADFRYNILTQIENLDAFKSWELLFMLNLTNEKEYSVILGTGMQKEQFQDDNVFNEFTVSTIFPINKTNKIDISSRFSVDFDSEAFPFFEFNTTYKQRLFYFKNLDTYLAIGATYQNYYESYDILGFRTGIVMTIHD